MSGLAELSLDHRQEPFEETIAVGHGILVHGQTELRRRDLVEEDPDHGHVDVHGNETSPLIDDGLLDGIVGVKGRAGLLGEVHKFYGETMMDDA